MLLLLLLTSLVIVSVVVLCSLTSKIRSRLTVSAVCAVVSMDDMENLSRQYDSELTEQKRRVNSLQMRLASKGVELRVRADARGGWVGNICACEFSLEQSMSVAPFLCFEVEVSLYRRAYSST